MRVATFRIISTLVLLLMSRLLGAQAVPPAEFDNKYTPNDASPFSGTNNREKGSGGDEVTIRHAIKFSPTALFRQKALFYYEGRLLDGLAVNIGIGKAFGNDFIQSSYFTVWSDDYDEEMLNAGSILSNSEYYGSGVLLSAGLRLYFSGTVFEDGYFEFNYRRETMSYQLEPLVSSYRVEGSTISDFRMSGFNFGFGVTNLGGARNKVTHEFFMLFGIKNFRHTSYQKVDNSQLSGSANDYIYRRQLIDAQAKILPSIHLGYAFGFGF